jgi:hypothetical protein
MPSTFVNLQSDVTNALHAAIKAQSTYSAAEVKRLLNRAYNDFVKRTRAIKDYVDITSVAEQVNYTSGNGITAATIAFVDSDPDTITDTGSGFVTAGFQSGQQIMVEGSSSNDGTYTIDTVAAGTITLISDDSVTAEEATATITITPKLSFIYEPYEIRLIKSDDDDNGYLLKPFPGGHGNLPRVLTYSATPEHFWTLGSGAQGEFEFGTYPILNDDDDTIRIYAFMYPYLRLINDADIPMLMEKDREALPLWVLWKMYKTYSFINPNWMRLAREYRDEYLEAVDQSIKSKTIDSEDGFPVIFDAYGESIW